MSGWRPMRRIGGSDIPKLLGLSPYGGPLEVYLRIVEGVDAPWKPIMERGAAVEPVLRAHGQRMFGLELEESNSDYHDHLTCEFARAQVDDLARWNGAPIVVEYKSVNRFARGWGADGSDEVPAHYAAQVAWQLFCTDRELALVVAGFGSDGADGFELTHVLSYQIQRDPVFESLCVQTAKEFWERHILPREAPPQPLGKKKRKAV